LFKILDSLKKLLGGFGLSIIWEVAYSWSCWVWRI